MAVETLLIETRPGDGLSQDETEAFEALFNQAFEEDYQPYKDVFKDPIHILGKLDGRLVSHALWVTRWLKVKDQPMLRTAYVEAVATDADYRRLGYATQIMQTLAKEIQGYDLGALSPADTSLYARLGWEFWQGPLYARKDGDWVLERGESAMILRTPKTPALDLHTPISIEWRPGEVW